MKRTYQQLDQLHRIVERDLVVRHIATFDLFAADPGHPGVSVRQKMTKLRIDVAPVADGQDYHKYIVAQELGPEPCNSFAHPIGVRDVVSADLPIVEVLEVLAEREFLFVLEGRRVVAIVTRADLQRVPIRLLLFGLITLFEMNLRAIVQQRHKNDSWTPLIGKRLAEAQKLQSERARLQEDVGLLECAQLCDLRDIVVKGPLLRELFPGESKSSLRARLRPIERYRDNVAHSQQLKVKDLLSILHDLRDLTSRTDQWLQMNSS